MDLRALCYNIIQTERDKYRMFSHMESKKSLNSETRMVVSKGLEMGEIASVKKCNL